MSDAFFKHLRWPEYPRHRTCADWHPRDKASMKACYRCGLLPDTRCPRDNCPQQFIATACRPGAPIVNVTDA